MANRYLLDKIYGGLKTIICWIKRLFMCKTSTIVDSEDCYKLIHHILEDSIQRLYSSIDDFLFQDIERYKVQRLMPQWICDGGLCPELKISKGEFEKVRQKFSTPIFGRFIYYYDLWSIIAALQDRLEAVDSFMRSFYSKVPSTRKYKDSDYTAAGRMGGREETEVHVLLNSIFISLASTFDLLSKIAVEQNNITKYKDFSNYKKMESRDALFNIKKLAHEIDPSLTDKGMLFAENRVVRIIETFRNEYVHNGPWDLRCSVYYTAINGEPADVIVYSPDIDENGNFVSSNSRRRFYSQGNAINIELPGLVNSVLKVLQRTIDGITILYQSKTMHKPSESGTEQCLEEIKKLYGNVIAN